MFSFWLVFSNKYSVWPGKLNFLDCIPILLNGNVTIPFIWLLFIEINNSSKDFKAYSPTALFTVPGSMVMSLSIIGYMFKTFYLIEDIFEQIKISIFIWNLFL